MQEKQRELQAPYQVVASKFRNSKRDTQRKLTQVLKTIVDLKNVSNYSRSQITKRLRSDKQKLIQIKRKLSQNAKQQSSIYELCKKRIHRQQQWQNTQNQTQAQNNIKMKDIFHRQIVYFLNSQGQNQKAAQVQTQLQIQDLTHLQTQLYTRANTIMVNIHENNLRQIKQWCFQNAHMLSKMKSPLQFKLISCEYINILNNSQIYRGVEFLRKSLQTLSLSDKDKKTVQKLTILLLTKEGENIDIKPYLIQLGSLFIDAFQKIYRVDLDLQFEKTLGMGISSLKTACCSKQALINPKICPICDPRINKLSEHIPMITKHESSIICRINGSLMSQSNPPMVLPNGQVYSLSGLNQSEKQGKYYCPNTQTYYDKNICKKVFLA